MAQHYRVIALSVGGLGNLIFNSQDIVTDENFSEGRAVELVEQGFLKEISDDEAGKKVEEKETLLLFDQITEEQLKKSLKKSKTAFIKDNTKEELYALYEASFEGRE